eukprot:5011418-Amphidinium_carterae.1
MKLLRIPNAELLKRLTTLGASKWSVMASFFRGKLVCSHLIKCSDSVAMLQAHSLAGTSPDGAIANPLPISNLVPMANQCQLSAARSY